LILDTIKSGQSIGVYRHYENQIARSAISPWGARDCSGNPFGVAKRLKREARFFAAMSAKNALLYREKNKCRCPEIRLSALCKMIFLWYIRNLHKYTVYEIKEGLL
jgi:hypothetical protein